MNVSCTLQGILAYGDDGNQYVIPDKNAGGDLQPFQVKQMDNYFFFFIQFQGEVGKIPFII